MDKLREQRFSGGMRNRRVVRGEREYVTMQSIEEGRYTIRRMLKLLVDRAWIVLATLALSVVVAVVVSYSLPKRYEASSTVYIEQSVINDLVRGIAVTPSMSAKIKVLKVTMLSRSMLLDVIRKLDMDLQVRSDQALESLIADVRKRVDISLNEQKGLFVISYEDTIPERARDFVNALTRRYIEESTTSKREEAFEATRFLAEQIELFRKRLEQAQEEIDSFKSEHGTVLNSSELAIRQEMEASEAKLQTLRIRKNELLARRDILLRNTPLRKRLEDLELTRTSLLVNYTEQHPNVRRVEEEIRALRAEVQRNGSSERNAVFGTAEYQSVRVELQAVEQTEQELEGKITENAEQLRRIPAIRSSLAELQRKKEKENIIYEQLASRYGQSEVSKQMELQDKAVSFRIIDAAVLPLYPISPNRVHILLAGLFLGLGSGVGIILLLDFLDGRVKSHHDLETLGIPIMAIVPDMDLLQDHSGGLLRGRWKLFLSGGLLLVSVVGLIVIESRRMPHVERIVEMVKNLIGRVIS